MYPEQLVDASFVPITDAHLDVPLYWQSWKLDSDTVAPDTDAVTAAAVGLRRRR
jgi:LysR family transcriptional regulator (chromosome initiation inhibitor)